MNENNIRASIKKYLSKKPRNTAEISSFLSKNNNLTNLDVAGILGSDNSIVRIGIIRNSGVIDSAMPLSEWATKDWVNHHGRSMVNNINGDC
tara:strand:- start:320 stop:595 length:276 start_codon:yes stop_codon:yes gene_type:complete